MSSSSRSAPCDRGRWAVYRVIDGVARLRPITLGQRNEDEAEIVAGLDAGDSVVLHPSDRVTDGTSVIARDQGGASRD